MMHMVDVDAQQLAERQLAGLGMNGGTRKRLGWQMRENLGGQEPVHAKHVADHARAKSLGERALVIDVEPRILLGDDPVKTGGDGDCVIDAATRRSQVNLGLASLAR